MSMNPATPPSFPFPKPKPQGKPVSVLHAAKDGLSQVTGAEKRAGCVGKPAIFTRRTAKWFGGKKGERREYETKKFEVVVMAIAGRYAMVRCKGCMPFVAVAKDLSPL